MLHHGENGWTEPVSLRELYDAPAEVLDALRPFLPELTFLLDDLAPQDDATLRARALSAVPLMTLWLFRHARRDRDAIPMLRKTRDLVSAILGAPNGRAALAVLMQYILTVTDSSPRDVQEVLDEHRVPEASEIVMTAAERLHEEGWKEGRKEGRKEGHKQGHKQGREQNQRENLRTLLSQRFGPLPAPVLARIRRAGLTRLQRWFERGITARNLDSVFADEP